MRTIPQAHPHASEPLLDDERFFIELWTDWVVLNADIPAYRNAVSVIPMPTMKRPYDVQGLATVNDGRLWVSLSLAGPGTPSDDQWALAEDLFHRMWESVHQRAMN